MRLMWQDDADADSTLEDSERFYFIHDERWRPVATFRDTDPTPKEAFVWHAAGSGSTLFGGTALQSGVFGGSSYIDSIILRDRDNYTGGTPKGTPARAMARLKNAATTARTGGRMSSR